LSFWKFFFGYTFSYLSFLYPFASLCKLHEISVTKTRVSHLLDAPNLRGLIHRVMIRSPKKPNSGMRKVAKIKVRYQGYYTRLTGRVTGNSNKPVKFNHVLIRGGRANDVPGVNYTLVRGTYDHAGLANKHRRRSLYGVSQPASMKTHLRRRYRKLI